MFKKGFTLILLGLIIALLSFTVSADNNAGQDTKSGVKIDHLMIKVPNVSSSFGLFNSSFGLPHAWNITDYHYYTSGGIIAGNVNLENLEVSDPANSGDFFPERYGIIGLIFEPVPSLNDTIAMLEDKGINHSEPSVNQAGVRDGVPVTFTNVYLEKFMNNSLVLLCNYSYNMDDRRNSAEDLLASINGGTLGLLKLTGIEITYSNETVHNNWQKLLPQVDESSPDNLNAGNGVTIKLVKGDTDAIPSIDLMVRSLSAAEKSLKEVGVNYTLDNASIIMKPKELPNTAFILKE